MMHSNDSHNQQSQSNHQPDRPRTSHDHPGATQTRQQQLEDARSTDRLAKSRLSDLRSSEPRSGETRRSPNWSRNEIVGGLEIRLPPGRHDAESLLKEAGWRWSDAADAWYHRDTPENEQFARQICQRY